MIEIVGFGEEIHYELEGRFLVHSRHLEHEAHQEIHALDVSHVVEVDSDGLADIEELNRSHRVSL